MCYLGLFQTKKQTKQRSYLKDIYMNQTRQRWQHNKQQLTLWAQKVQLITLVVSFMSMTMTPPRPAPPALLLCLAVIILLAHPSHSAYNQGDEGKYLLNFNDTIAASYAAVDDATLVPNGLTSQCKDTGLLDFSVSPSEIILQPDGNDPSDPSISTVSAASAQSQCTASPEATSTAICVIPVGVRLVMSSSLVVPALVVRGELYWRDADQVAADQFICAGFVAVEDHGKFIMNVQDSSKRSWIYIKDNGAVHPVGRERYFGGVAPHHNEAGASPTVEITGRKMTRTWSLLSNPFLAGQSTMKLLHSPIRMGWRVGDRIGIASTVPSSGGTGQSFAITAMDDDGTVTLDGASDQDHRADFYPPVKAGQVNTLDPLAAALLSAEVTNLSRNVIITGDDYRHVPCDPNLPEAVGGEQTSTQGCRCASYRTTCTIGLHTAQMHAGTMSIRSVRVEKCGQRGVEGKYCLHFHKLYSCPDCTFADNAIEQSHQRGIIIHGTHLSRVENNVLWDVRGAGIYVEDGNEMYNHIKYNVVICPWRFEDQVLHGENRLRRLVYILCCFLCILTHFLHFELLLGCTIPGSSNSQADTANNQAGIYTETAANDLIGNRVANSFNGMLLQANDQGRGEAYGKVCTGHLEFGRFEGNTFHSHLRFGTYSLGGSLPRTTDQSIANNGYNYDRATSCAAIDAAGEDRGAPVSILNNLDYGNVFVGHYTAGDIQHRGHKSYSNNNLIYWKETKNMADGCGSHISDAHYEYGNMALPDQSTFIIQDTTFGNNVQLEANHHCNVGVTGFLCMPQYILDNVRWTGTGTSRWTWLQRGRTGGGGIFSLSPPDANAVMSATPEQQAAMRNQLFPPGFVSVASGHYTYLLSAPGDLCVTAASIGSVEASRYDAGILCKVPLRALKIYTRNLEVGTAASLQVEVWFDNLGIASQLSNPPTTTQAIEFHAVAGLMGGMKQGYTFPVIPTSDVSYRLSTVAVDATSSDDIPADWILEFSDPVVGNRWAVEYIQMTIQGRDCGTNGRVSSQHDRRFMNNLFVDETAWGAHGACVGPNQPPDMSAVDCAAEGGGKGNSMRLQ